MSDETIAARKAKFLAAGYTVQVRGFSHYLAAYVGAPDEWEYIGKDVLVNHDNYDVIQAKCENEAIEKAYAHFQQQEELESLRRFKALSKRVFESPRELDMMAASLSMEERQWLKAQYEGKE